MSTWVPGHCKTQPSQWLLMQAACKEATAYYRQCRGVLLHQAHMPCKPVVLACVHQQALKPSWAHVESGCFNDKPHAGSMPCALRTVCSTRQGSCSAAASANAVGFPQGHMAAPLQCAQQTYLKNTLMCKLATQALLADRKVCIAVLDLVAV